MNDTLPQDTTQSTEQNPTGTVDQPMSVCHVGGCLCGPADILCVVYCYHTVYKLNSFLHTPCTAQQAHS